MVEKINFRKLFGNTGMIKLLDFFIMNREKSWHRTEIRNRIGSSYLTLYTGMSFLVNWEIIKIVRSVSKKNWPKYYQLNMDSPISKKLVELSDIINKSKI